MMTEEVGVSCSNLMAVDCAIPALEQLLNRRLLAETLKRIMA